MTLPRRRLIRPASVAPPPPQRQRQTQRLRERLVHELATLARWQRRLQRAFTTTRNCQKRIVRIERQLARLEE